MDQNARRSIRLLNAAASRGARRLAPRRSIPPNRSDPQALPRYRVARPFVLATDLDGTFAAGVDETRRALVAAMRATAETRIIYVTGRSPESTRRLMDRIDLPAPDLLIADVGSSVISKTGERVAEIETHIAGRWPGSDTVRARLAGTRGIAEQDVRSPHRVSYVVHSRDDLRPAVRRVRRRLRQLTTDLIDSDGQYIDVLPRGVNKGTTLRRVLAWLGLPEDRTVIAGDSLNDLSLFETGMAAVLVGNAEPRLSRRVSRHAHVHASAHEGVDAIVDGLTRFGYLNG